MVLNQALYFRRRLANSLFIALSLGAAIFGLLWLSLILYALLKNGVSALSVSLFTEITPPPGAKGGLLNAIFGSVVMSLGAVLIGTPVGLFAGTYLAEYARHGRLALVVRFVNDILLSGPSIVTGLFIYELVVRPMHGFSAIAGTLSLATPLVFGALCGVLCERAGVVNVSIEGQFLASAFAAAVVGSVTQSVPMALLAAMIAGVVMAALLALFSITYLVNQVVLGVVLNLLAVGVTGFLFDQLVQPASAAYNNAPVLESIPIPLLSDIPFFGKVLFNQNILAYLAGLAVLVVWLILFKTSWGLRVRSVGEHPEAADTVGISVRGVRWSAVLAGGLLAGLGGSFFTLASTGSFSKEFTVGNGFIALAALIMGRWHPGLAALMALFFGFVTQMASQLQTLSTPMPSQFLLILPYVATIIAVAGLVGRVRAPAADGIPYEKS